MFVSVSNFQSSVSVCDHCNCVGLFCIYLVSILDCVCLCQVIKCVSITYFYSVNMCLCVQWLVCASITYLVSVCPYACQCHVVGDCVCVCALLT